MLYRYTFFEHPVHYLQNYVCDFMIAADAAAKANRSFRAAEICHPDFQRFVNRSKILKKHLSNFYNVFKALSPAERRQVILSFTKCSDPGPMFKNNCRCYSIQSLPTAIKKPAKDLFGYLYKNTLNSVGDVRDHYKKVYDNLPSNWCPFCAIERMQHYDHYKQDYDHLLPKCFYPFAAVNMRNLVPMGRDCNTIFKKTKDLLHDEMGKRRKAFYPFDPAIKITLSLKGSSLPTAVNRKGTWHIKLFPNIEEVRTWNDVFKISDRYAKNVLEADYDSWISALMAFARTQENIPRPWTESRIKILIKRFSIMFDKKDYREQRFLKHALCLHWINGAKKSFYDALIKALP